ncbi:hypothetical protein YC2023_117168 [Brassica napus]
METLSKASIDRHQPDEIDRHSPYIIDQHPPYIIVCHPPDSIDLHPPDCIDRQPSLAKEAVGFLKRVKRIHDPVKFVVPCAVVEVEFPIPPDRSVHLGSYNEVSDDHMYAVASQRWLRFEAGLCSIGLAVLGSTQAGVHSEPR